MIYLLIYLGLGLPVSIAGALANVKTSVPWRILLSLVMWSFWPLFVLVLLREWWTLKRMMECCFWCGMEVTAHNNPDRREVWTNHYLHGCDKHPLKIEIVRLYAEFDLWRAEFGGKRIDPRCDYAHLWEGLDDVAQYEEAKS